MEKRTVLETEYASVWFYPEAGIVYQQIHKFMKKGVYRQLATAGLRCIEDHGATKWLSDNRANPVTQPEDVQWVTNILVPRAIRAGLKYWALVMPHLEAGKMQMRTLIDDFVAQGVVVKVFDEPDSARSWLEAMPGPATK